MMRRKRRLSLNEVALPSLIVTVGQLYLFHCKLQSFNPRIFFCMNYRTVPDYFCFIIYAVMSCPDSALLCDMLELQFFLTDSIPIEIC